MLFCFCNGFRYSLKQTRLEIVLKVKNKAKRIKVSQRHSTLSREVYLGVDGGGTKTRAVLVNGKNEVLGEGVAGPSNPLRVGVQAATDHICEAVDIACDVSNVRRKDIVSAEIGLAGVRRQDIRSRMHDVLAYNLNVNPIEIVTDADIALYGATNGAPGLVVIAGTGSICCGINATGKRACTGGWGPIAGDEGSGYSIAQNGLRSVAQASDGRGKMTKLVEAAQTYFRADAIEDIAMAIYAPNMRHERLAGFARCVVDAARAGDETACDIMTKAGEALGVLAVSVISQLSMEKECFQVAFVGGVFKAEELIKEPMLNAIRKIAPKAYLAPPQLDPAIAATRMAHLLVKSKLALAV